MYTVETADIHAGRETVTVRSRGRLVGTASIDFIRWMHDRVPSRQLRPEQMALVDWYRKHAGV